MSLDVLRDPLTGNLDLSGGRVNFTSAPDVVAAQRIGGVLDLVRGEYFLDQGRGIDYVTLMQGKDEQALLRAVTDAVLADPDAASAGLQVSRAGRVATISGVVRLTSEVAIEISSVLP